MSVIIGEPPKCPHIGDLGDVCAYQQSGGCWADKPTRASCDDIHGLTSKVKKNG